MIQNWTITDLFSYSPEPTENKYSQISSEEIFLGLKFQDGFPYVLPFLSRRAHKGCVIISMRVPISGPSFPATAILLSSLLWL